MSQEEPEDDLPEEAPITYDDVKNAVSSVIWKPIFFVLLIAVIGVAVYAFVNSVRHRTDWRAELQDSQQDEILGEYQVGGQSSGIYYLPEDKFFLGYRNGSAQGVYFVRPVHQTSNAQTMALHLLLRAETSWEDKIPFKPDMHRERIGQMQLVYQGGVPVAAYCMYREVRVGDSP